MIKTINAYMHRPHVSYKSAVNETDRNSRKTVYLVSLFIGTGRFRCFPPNWTINSSVPCRNIWALR